MMSSLGFIDILYMRVRVVSVVVGRRGKGGKVGDGSDVTCLEVIEWRE